MGIEQEIRHFLGPDEEPDERRRQLRRAGDLFQRVVQLVDEHLPDANHAGDEPMLLLLVASNSECTHYAAIDLGSEEPIKAQRVFGSLQIAQYMMREDSLDADHDPDDDSHTGQLD